jgi:hypothetical protein
VLAAKTTREEEKKTWRPAMTTWYVGKQLVAHFLNDNRWDNCESYILLTTLYLLGQGVFESKLSAARRGETEQFFFSPAMAPRKLVNWFGVGLTWPVDLCSNFGQMSDGVWRALTASRGRVEWCGQRLIQLITGVCPGFDQLNSFKSSGQLQYDTCFGS